MQLLRPITTFSNLYEVSTDGKVYSLNYHREGRKAELKPSKDKDGYLQVGLRAMGKRKWLRVHRLVADAFIPNPDDFPQVNHINGNKLDNRLENLEWCTPSHNIKHAFHKLHKSQRGEKNNATKLTNGQVALIWKMKGQFTQKIIAKQFNTTEDIVSMIHRQVTWKWLTDSLI